MCSKKNVSNLTVSEKTIKITDNTSSKILVPYKFSRWVIIFNENNCKLCFRFKWIKKKGITFCERKK